MLKINKQSITLTKGDDASLRLVPRYKDKTIYTVQEGDSAIFRLKVGASVKELECVINLENNKIVVNFTPSDTKDFEPGIYRYEAELITSLGFHYTFIADQPFILGNEIEQRLSNATSANGNSNGNYPEIDGEIGDEPVVNGDIQPTNPMLDYEELNHLPKLNGKTIKGDKDNEYYGIPTKVSDIENDLNFVSDEDYVHTDNNYDDTDKDKVDSLGTASTKNVPTEGNASPTEVVMGSDTRLSDSRPASDVYEWAKASTKPQYSYSEIQNTPTLGTAVSKNSTNAVTSGSTDLVESGAVKSAIDSALSSAYKHGGTKTVEELTSALLIEANQGYVYNITNDGVTTADFIEGAGKPIRAGDNVGIAKVGNVYKFDLLSGFIDTSNFVEKSSTNGLIKNDGSVDTTAYAKQSEMSVSESGDQTTIQLKNGTSATVIRTHQDISGKANKSEMFITDGTGADADKATIQLKTDLSKTVLIAHQDISGKANKSEMSVTDGTDEDADKTTIQLKSGTSATVLKTHQDISGKADKVSGATNGNLAGLDGNGNLTDSGIAKTDVEEMQSELSTNTATAEGNPINFSTLSAQTAQSTIIDLEPIQDLHGYSNPWVGGAGKNKLPYPYNETTTTNNGVKYTDNGNGTVSMQNTSTARSIFKIQNPIDNFVLANGSYILSKGFQNNYISVVVDAYNNSTWVKTLAKSSNDDNVNFTIDNDGYNRLAVYIEVLSGIDTNNITVKPMIRLATETDSSFAPYTNICPITGRTQDNILGCGTNVWNEEWEVGGLVPETGADNPVTNRIRSKGYIPIVANTSYYSVFPNNRDDIRICYYNKNKDFISSTAWLTKGVFISPQNASYMRFYLGTNYGTTYNNDISINRPSTDTQYHAYTLSNDITISFGQTVYGATLDVGRGLLVIDRVIETFDGSEDENWQSDRPNYRVFTNSLSSVIKSVTSGVANIISSQFPAVDANVTYRGENGIAVGGTNVFIADDSLNITVANWKTYLSNNPLQVVYELDTPITLEVTPHQIALFEGVNNISTDGDKITLTYRDGSVATLGDVKALGDNLTQEIADSQILTDTVTGDKYKLVVTSGVLSIEQISN